MADHEFETTLGAALAVAVKEILGPLRAEIVAIKAERAAQEGRIRELEAAKAAKTKAVDTDRYLPWRPPPKVSTRRSIKLGH